MKTRTACTAWRGCRHFFSLQDGANQDLEVLKRKFYSASYRAAAPLHTGSMFDPIRRLLDAAAASLPATCADFPQRATGQAPHAGFSRGAIDIERISKRSGTSEGCAWLQPERLHDLAGVLVLHKGSELPPRGAARVRQCQLAMHRDGSVVKCYGADPGASHVFVS